jgi:cytochrome c-type biogenesis protein CcmH
MRALLLIAAVFWATTALAAPFDTPLPNAAQEARAQALFGQLRCVVCAGQSLADSNAALARQMRMHVRTQVEKGATDPEIIAFFVVRYGEEALLAPPTHGPLALLWTMPALLLLGGIAYLIHRYRRSP